MRLVRLTNSLFPLGILFVFSILFFFRLFYPHLSIIATAEIGINDVWYFNLPMKWFLSESLLRGELPLWSAAMGGGFPVFAEGQIGALNAWNLITFWLLDPIVAFNVGIVASFFLLSLGMYLYLQSLPLSKPLSLLGSIVFSYSGFFVAHISHFALLQAASFFPLLMYLSLRFSRFSSMGNGLLLAVVFSQQIFAGFPQIAFITLLAMTGQSVFQWMSKRCSFAGVILFCMAICFGLILSSGQIIPTLELTAISQRAGGVSAREGLLFKYPPKHLLSFVDPFYFGNPQKGTYPHFNEFNGSLFWENTGYIGLLPIVCSVISFFWIRRIPNATFYSLGLLFSMLLMFGGAGPFYFLLTLPPFSYFRFSSRYLMVFVFFAVIFFTWGAHFLLTTIRNKRQKSVFLFMGYLIAVGNVVVVWWQYHPLIRADQLLSTPTSVSLLKHEQVSGVYTYLANTRAFTEFFSHGSSRRDRYLDFKNELAPNSNLLFSIPTTDAYAALVPTRLSQLYGALQSPLSVEGTASAQLSNADMKYLNLRNTTHIISPIPLTNSGLVLLKRFMPTSLMATEPYYMYANSNALPFYQFRTKYRTIGTLQEFVRTFQSEMFDPAREALVETTLPFESSDNELSASATGIMRSQTRIELETQSSESAILSLAHSYYPGWKATIDGKRSPVHPVNVFNMGLTIPGGRHAVTFTFEPDSVRLGLIVSTVSYSVAIASLLYWHNRRRTL